MWYRKLIKLSEFVADFKKGEEASLNCCRLSNDNCLIATGGDDCNARIFSLTTGKGFSLDTLPKDSINPILTLEGHCDPVNCVSFSPDSKLLITSSSDRSCIIFNIDRTNPRTMGQRMHKLTFSDGTNDAKNMLMRGCFFSLD
jgi:WD40 repeat protein